MKSYVAVHKPDPGIVRFERYHHEAIGREQDDIPAGRISEVQFHEVVEVRGVDSLVRLLENCKVVAVEMNLEDKHG